MNRVLFGLAGLALAATFVATSATAATVSVALGTDSTSCFNTNNGTCFSNGGLFGSDFGGAHNASGGTSANLVGVGSTSTALSVNAVTAVDGGGDIGSNLNINIGFSIQVDVDNALDTWTVDLSQSALGLYGLRGDGTASAVGTQQNGSAALGPVNLTIDGSAFNFAVANSSYSNNPSNNGSASQQFSGSRSDIGVLSGTGDQTVTGNISINLSAFSNDGCSGFICSSISGGEEAAVLFGAQSVMDQAVDEYSTWGRSITPDGYTGDITLNVTSIPEPTTLGLLGLALSGLAYGGRRR